jgi:hypothetical protein
MQYSSRVELSVSYNAFKSQIKTFTKCEIISEEFI